MKVYNTYHEEYVVIYIRTKSSDITSSRSKVMKQFFAVVGHAFSTKEATTNYLKSIISHCFNTTPKKRNGIYSINYNGYTHNFDILKFIDIHDIEDINKPIQEK